MNSISDAIDLVSSKLNGWLQELVAILPNFVVALLIVGAFWLIARLGRKLIRKTMTRFTDSQALISLVAKLGYVGIVLSGMFVALSVMHLDKTVTSLLAGIGVVGLALGFAFQDIASNFVAGVLMATRRPMRIGHLVETNDFLGHVHAMNLRATTIRTFEGQDVIIPNKEIFQNPLINFSTYPKRRVDISVGLSYGDDLEKAARIAVEAVEKLKERDTEKPVDFFYHEFGDSSINGTVRLWVNECEQPQFLQARSQAIIAIKQAFEREELTIPFPIRTLDFGIKGGKSISSTELHVLNENAQN